MADRNVVITVYILDAWTHVTPEINYVDYALLLVGDKLYLAWEEL